MAAVTAGSGGVPGVAVGRFAGRGKLPLGMTTIIGFAFFSASRLSRMKPAMSITTASIVQMTSQCE